MKMLILTSTPASYSIKRLIEEGEKHNHEMITENPVALMTYISSTIRGYDMTYKKSTPDNALKRVLYKSYDVIIPRIGGANIFEFGASLTEHLSGNMSIPSTSWSFGLRIATNKLMSAQAFSHNNERTTKSVFAYKPRDFGRIPDKLGGFPIVAKTMAGSFRQAGKLQLPGLCPLCMAGFV